ncbi:hypothetical protein [Streptomyces canus]|uniref:hypothetical protein n=1 Tax=Streptomyces canus TaxID=58343 RepID=UPI003863B816|nr:hypothetical protein OH824_14300 [Streptomyces canus]
MPSIAPFVAAFRRRLANLPGPAQATGEASNGEPVTVELLVAGEWIDLTVDGYVLVRDDNGQIRITYGITGGEGSQTERGQAQLQLKNTDGRFSPRNPAGPYYKLIGRNTPLRVSVPDGNGGKSYRIWGEVSDWARGWDSTGTDVWVDTNVAGPMQRLAQGPAPAHSVIYQAITEPNLTGLVAYWPCEDPTGSVQLASALTNGSAMTWTGNPVLATFEGFGASDALPTLTGASLTGGVTRYDTASGQHQTRYLLAVPKSGFSDLDVISRIQVVEPSSGAAVTYFDVHYNAPAGGVGSYGATGTLTLLIRDGDEAELATSGTPSISLDVRGRMLRVSVEVSQSGANIAATLRVLDINSGITDSAAIGLVTATVTRVMSVSMAPATISQGAGATGAAVGHVTVQTTLTDITDLGRAIQPSGEAAGRRMQRLCAEEGVAFDWVGDLDDTVPLGPQAKQNLLAHAQEACLADGGLLFENRAVLGLGYRTRASLYTQDPALILSYTGYNLSEVPTPTEDDRQTQNILTVTAGGISATYEQTDGPLGTDTVGRYGESSGLTLNLAATDQATLLDHAAWRVGLGTVDEERYPQISVNLAHSSITPELRRAILALRLGDRIQITNPPAPWCAPDTIDQLLLGIDESINHFQHKLTFTCAPSSPYNAIGYLDNTSARVDTDGSVLYTDASSSATQIDVAPSPGLTGLWTTDGGEPPWDIHVGGERMTVTAVSSKGADTFTRTASSTWGTADSGQTWTSLFQSASERSVDGTRGVMTLSSSLSAVRINTLVNDITDAEVLCKITPGQVSLTQPFLPGIILRYINSSTFYRVRVYFQTDNTVWADITNGTSAIISPVNTGRTYAANDAFWIRARVDTPHRVRARIWRDDEAEPAASDWHVDQAIGSNTANSGAVGISCNGATGITNPSLVAYYDEFYLLSPQTMSVTRSVNGVVKNQAAGESVALADPTHLAL